MNNHRIIKLFSDWKRSETCRDSEAHRNLLLCSKWLHHLNYSFLNEIIQEGHDTQPSQWDCSPILSQPIWTEESPCLPIKGTASWRRNSVWIRSSWLLSSSCSSRLGVLPGGGWDQQRELWWNVAPSDQNQKNSFFYIYPELQYR